MQLKGKGKAVAIFVGEDDRWNNKTLYTAIVERARAEKLAGATVTRGIVGFGPSSFVSAPPMLQLSNDQPIVVTIIDLPERIECFMPILHEMVQEGMVATWDVDIELYKVDTDRG